MGLSPGRPLGAAPVPIVPGVDVFGTPGWLIPPGLIPVVPGVLGVVGAIVGGVAGETPGEPGGAVGEGVAGLIVPWAAATRVDPTSVAAAMTAICN